MTNWSRIYTKNYTPRPLVSGLNATDKTPTFEMPLTFVFEVLGVWHFGVGVSIFCLGRWRFYIGDLSRKSSL